MSFDVQKKDGRWYVQGELSVYNARAARDQLREAGKSIEGPCLLDLSEVTEMDSAGLQVILIITRAARTAGRMFAIIDPSEAARSALSLAGLSGMILEPIRSEVRA